MEDVVIGATGPERIGTDVALDTVVNADGTLASLAVLVVSAALLAVFA